MFQKVVCQNSVESKPNPNHIPKPKLFLIFQVYASFHFHSPGFIQYAAVSILVLYLYLFLAFFFFLLLWLKVLTFRLVPKKTEDFKFWVFCLIFCCMVLSELGLTWLDILVSWMINNLYLTYTYCQSRISCLENLLLLWFVVRVSFFFFFFLFKFKWK